MVQKKVCSDVLLKCAALEDGQQGKKKKAGGVALRNKILSDISSSVVSVFKLQQQP